MKNCKVTIIINQEPFHFDQNSLSPDDFRSAAQKPNDYEVWKVVKAPDPEGELPRDDIQITCNTPIKNGERYRVVPPGTFGIQQSIPLALKQDVESLRVKGHDVELHLGEGMALVVFRQYQLPAGFSNSATDLLIKSPLSYPDGKLDMFWVSNDLTLEDGRVPHKADKIEESLGSRWRRFSWHPSSWNPGTDNIETFLEFVDCRLAKRK